MILSPSRIVIGALKLPEVGTMTCSSEQAGSPCAVCGAPLVEGSPIDTMELPDSFTNHSSLAHPGENYRCGACTAIMTRKEFKRGLATILACKDGVFPIMKKEHRAWAFLTPPDPPFVIAIQNVQSQHTLWRAPVTLSTDLMLVRLGEQILRIRRKKLLAARDAAMRLHDIMQSESHKKRRKSNVSQEGIGNPFVTDWKGQSVQMGTLKREVTEIITKGKFGESDTDALLTLNSAEIWALTAVLHANPQKPEPVNSI